MHPINKKKFLNKTKTLNEGIISLNQIQDSDEVPMNGSIDKITFQVAFIVISYFIAYLIMLGVSRLLPSLENLIYGFNFLFGVLVASLLKIIVNFLKSKNVIHRQYLNCFLMQRLSGICFDIMRTPLSYLMMYDSLFKTSYHTSIRSTEGCSREGVE